MRAQSRNFASLGLATLETLRNSNGHVGFLLLSRSAALVQRRDVEHVQTSEGARSRLQLARYDGMVVDLAVPCVRSLLEEVRASYPLLPLLLLAPAERPELINLAQPLRAQCLVAPIVGTDLEVFFRRALGFGPVRAREVAGYLARFGEEYGLTARECDLLEANLRGVRRSELLLRYQISENTLKSQVRGLLRKTGQASVDALLRSVLRDVLFHAHRHPTRRSPSTLPPASLVSH